MSFSWILPIVIGLVAYYVVRARSMGAIGGQGQSTGRMEFDDRDGARRLLPPDLIEERGLLCKELAKIGAARTEYPWVVLGTSGDGKMARQNFEGAQAWAAEPG